MIRPALRRAAGALLVIAIVAGASALSRIPYTADPRAHAVLRLSWRTRGERVETCRTLADSEFFALPAHMRQRQQCVGGVAPYRLSQQVDDDALIVRIVRAADLRQSRPLYVFAETPLVPGRHRVRVVFGREDSAASTAGAATLDTSFTLAPREVALVTYDADKKMLVLITGAADSTITR